MCNGKSRRKTWLRLMKRLNNTGPQKTVHKTSYKHIWKPSSKLNQYYPQKRKAKPTVAHNNCTRRRHSTRPQSKRRPEGLQRSITSVRAREGPTRLYQSIEQRMFLGDPAKLLASCASASPLLLHVFALFPCCLFSLLSDWFDQID